MSVQSLGRELVSTGSRRDKARVVGLRGHVKTRETQSADQKISAPEWLSDANIDAFMASVDAPEAALVG